MQKELTDIDRMIMESHYLNALEVESRAETPLSEMERQDFLNLLQSKDETIAQFKSLISSLEKALDADAVERKTLLEQIAKLTAEVAKLNDYNQRHNKFSFGKKSLKSSSKPDTKPSREEEKDHYDGTPGSVSSSSSNSSVPAQTPDGIDLSKVSSKPLDKKRGPRGPYTTMDAAKVEILESRTDLIPAGMRIVGFKDEDEFTRESYVKCTRYRLVVLEDEFGVRHEMYIPKDGNDSRRPKANVIDGTHCTPEFLASLAMDRFQLHLPVYREAIRLTNEKMSVCQQTVSNWLGKGSVLLQNLLPCLKQLLLKAKSVLNIDESWCRVRIVSDEFQNGKYFKKYVWVVVNKINKLVYFLYDNDTDDSRGTLPIANFLEGFIGGIQTDAYAGYRFFVKLNPENEHILCWCHVRAKFKLAFDISKDKDAGWFVEQIGRLYAIELENRLLNRTDEQIRERRNRIDVTEILNKLLDRANRMLKDKRIHFGEMMNTALNYMINGWEKLLNYRHDGRYDIDNLEAERKIRPLTIGRKNTLFFGSEEGVEVAMTYYTLIETAKLNDLSPLDYLTHVFRQLMEGNKDYESLLPGKLALQTI